MNNDKIVIRLHRKEPKRKKLSNRNRDEQTPKRIKQICLLIFVGLCSYKLLSEIIMTSSYIIHAERQKPVNINDIADNQKGVVKILLYTSTFDKKSSMKNRNYEVHQRMFIPDEKSNESLKNKNLDKKKKYQILYKAHKEYLRKVIIDYDIVLFHVKDMPGGRLLKEINKLRPSHQLWAYFNKESPFNTLNIVDGRYDGLFNITITPKRESDVFSPYGLYHKKNISQPWLPQSNISVIFDTTMFNDIGKKPMNYRLLQEGKLRNMQLNFKEKDLFIAWVVSNCNQLRDFYVQDLLPYLPIHIYGKCGKHFKQKRTCYKNDFLCEILLRRYKFVLALENSFCNDYISDKYWNGIFRGNIPIVLGGSNYDNNLVIPNSYINIRDFNSSKSLSKYILFLSENEAEYEKYMQWRKHFVVDYIPNDHHRYDNVIKRLYELASSSIKSNKIYNLSTFYGAKGNCPLQYNFKRKL